MDYKRKQAGILLLKNADEDREIELELAYLSAMTTRQRFVLMERKSRELRVMLRRHGHGIVPSISKRK